MAEVTDLSTARTRTKPQKNAGTTTGASAADFMSANEVRNLKALKKRLSEMLARPDIHERDFKAISVEYRAVMVELKDAEDRAKAARLGKRAVGAKGAASLDGDI